MALVTSAAQSERHDLARETPDLSLVTMEGEVVGTPAYMPPEQARGEKLDQRADVYALGALLYHVLSGRTPYHGSSDEIVEQVTGGGAPVERLTGKVPQDVEDLIFDLLNTGF